MNPFDTKIQGKKFEGLYYGQVLNVEDTESAKRIKVRVRGVFDTPVLLEHIPWATPIIDCPVPTLGSEVAVVFKDGAHDQPQYLSQVIRNKEDRERLSLLYKAIIALRNEGLMFNIDVAGDTVSIPEYDGTDELTPSKKTDIYEEDVTTVSGEEVDRPDPEKGSLQQVNMEKDKEDHLTVHPTGAFHQFDIEGSFILRAKKDLMLSADADGNILLNGKLRLYASTGAAIQLGALKMTVAQDGTTAIETTKPVTLSAQKIDLTGTQEVNIDSAKTQIKGAAFQVDGLATPAAGKGPFNCIPICPFTGATHIGNISANN